jgi:hypothetical protein
MRNRLIRSAVGVMAMVAMTAISLAQPPGGFGGPFGGPGGGPPMRMFGPAAPTAATLLEMPEVQAELKLTEEQKKSVNALLQDGEDGRDAKEDGGCWQGD